MRHYYCGIIFFCSSLLWPQTDLKISKTMIGTFNFTQTAHDNWTQGGEDLLTWFLDMKSDYRKESGKDIFQISGHANYGKTRIADSQPRKSMDELKLDFFYTRKLGWTVDPYFSAQLLTQLAAGYQYTDTARVQVSAFLNPGYFIQTLGIGYSVEGRLAARIGASMKETVAKRFPVPVMDSPGVTESFRGEMGIQAELDWKHQIGKQSRITSELDLFSGLDRIINIDVIWDNNFSTQIAKYFQTSFQYKIIYDRDFSLKRQVKSVLSFGIQYSFL